MSIINNLTSILSPKGDPIAHGLERQKKFLEFVRKGAETNLALLKQDFPTTLIRRTSRSITELLCYGAAAVTVTLLLLGQFSKAPVTDPHSVYALFITTLNAVGIFPLLALAILFILQGRTLASLRRSLKPIHHCVSFLEELVSEAKSKEKDLNAIPTLVEHNGIAKP